MASAFRLAVAAALLVMLAPVKPLSAQAPSLSAEQLQVVDTVKAIFAAAETDDLAKFHSVTSPTFYIFDNGRRFDGDAIMTLIKTQHVAGKRYEWNVTQPDVHVRGDHAWIAYVNQGSITDAFGKNEQQWLESAVLRKQNGVWKIEFMHSTRAAAPAQRNEAK